MKSEDDKYLQEILTICSEFYRDHVDNEGYSTDLGRNYGWAYRAAIELYIVVSMRIYPDKKINKEDVLLLVEKGISFK